MCTAISLGHLSGRNLDVEISYGAEVIITPRKYKLAFKSESSEHEHFAIIGIGIRQSNYPLYFDAVNEHGLYAAGLNYVENAKYHKAADRRINLAPYELIPYILSKCKSVSEAKAELLKINLIDIPFNDRLPLAELHFFIADKNNSITVEPDKDGLSIYDNPVGVLTNNPSFPLQLHNLSNYAGLSNGPIVNRLAPTLDLSAYSKGMGALGLPGDLSSESRFVRAAFHKLNLVNNNCPCDLFHLLSSVEMPKGSLRLEEKYEYTEYSSVVDTRNIEYFFRTYESYSIFSAKLSLEDCDSESLISYPLHTVSKAQNIK